MASSRVFLSQDSHQNLHSAPWLNRSEIYSHLLLNYINDNRANNLFMLIRRVRHSKMFCFDEMHLCAQMHCDFKQIGVIENENAI